MSLNIGGSHLGLFLHLLSKRSFIPLEFFISMTNIKKKKKSSLKEERSLLAKSFRGFSL
jgi:hypothetical protein